MSNPNPASPYRADVDGLRALAVLAVVFFHAEIVGFSGGYVGVDVFFVISGYLITKITASKSLEPWPSFRDFYERRARRILPALIPVSVFSLLVCWILYPPPEFMDFAQSLASLFLFSSNFLFWMEADYFTVGAETKPLLHTWSLAVEEQFYLLYPVCFVLGARYLSRYRSALLLGMLGLSFAVGVWMAEAFPSAAFYLLPGRVWEFLLGVVLALGLVGPVHRPMLKEMLVFAGLVLILYSVIAFDGRTAFPGFNALIPCLGAALVILGGEGRQGIVSRLLSARALVFIGVISYSVYLWHWPLLVFFRSVAGRALHGGEFVVYLAVVICLGFLSWTFVETPFRRRRQFPLSYRWFARLALPACAALIVVGLAGHLENGFPKRFSKDLLSLYSAHHGWSGRQVDCSDESPENFDVDSLCLIGDRSREEVSFIVWGDSHAQALFPVFDELGKKYHVKGYYAVIQACPPLYGVDIWFNRSVRECADSFVAIRKKIEQEEVGTVFLAARWAAYIHGFHEVRRGGDGISNLMFNPAYFGDAQLPPREEPVESFRYALEATLDRLDPDKYEIHLVEQVPLHEESVPRRLFLDRLLGRDIDTLGRAKSEHLARQSDVKKVFNRLQREFGFSLIDPASALCDQNRCKMVMDGNALYVDRDHLALAGAMELADVFQPVFEDLPDRLRPIRVDVSRRGE